MLKKLTDGQRKNQRDGLKIGVLATDETKALYKADIVLSAGSRNDEVSIGANLFKILRKFDYLDADIVFSEVFFRKG